MSQSGTTHTGSGGGAGKVNIQDLFVTKHLDKASPNLMLYCCSGKHIKEMKLNTKGWRKSSGVRKLHNEKWPRQFCQ